MRTTPEIPDDLFRDVKAMAVLEGIKLKDFVADGLRLRMETARPDSAAARRTVRLPVVRSAHPGRMDLTGEMIAEVEAWLDAGDAR